MPDGKYAVDNDKRWDIDENILSDLVSLSAALEFHTLRLFLTFYAVFSGSSDGKDGDQRRKRNEAVHAVQPRIWGIRGGEERQGGLPILQGDPAPLPFTKRSNIY